MRRAWLLFGIALLSPGCDARKLFGEGWTEQKSCENTNPDCVFQTGTSTKQQICEPTSGQCRSCGKGPAAMSMFDLAGGSKECRTAYQKQIVCDASTFECRACRVGNQECIGSDKTKPVCDTGSGECRTCSTATECKQEGFITCSGGQCQPCAVNSDCAAIDTNTPFCDKTGGPSPVCRGCMVDSECDTQLCDTGKNPLVNEGKAGRCVAKSSIAWVDNNPSCVAAGADGSDTKPFCTADAAYNSGAKYLYLKASGTTYTLSVAISRDLILIGKGTDPSKVTVNGLGFNVPGKLLSTTNLTIKDTAKPLVQCTGGTIRLYKTYLDGGVSGGAMPGPRGLDASGSCTEVEVQQSKIINLASAGISITGSTKYTIVNTGVFNAALNADSGVILNSSTIGVFTANTMRFNGKNGSATSGGLDCGNVANNRKIVNTVVMNNIQSSMTGSQLTGNCELTKVVVGMFDATTLPNALKKNCTFANATDGQLMATDTNCIDQADQDAMVTEDFFGTKRPLGAAPDIGYHEAK